MLQMGTQSHFQSKTPVDQNESTAAFPGVPLHARAHFKQRYTWVQKPLFLMENNKIFCLSEVRQVPEHVLGDSLHLWK